MALNSRYEQVASVVIKCMVAATRMSELQQCGITQAPRASAWAAMRRHSVSPPARATSGWMIRSLPQSISSAKPKHVDSFSRVATGVGECATNSLQPFMSSGESDSSRKYTPRSAIACPSPNRLLQGDRHPQTYHDIVKSVQSEA